MADHGHPKPLAVAILLALVLTAWCLASNSLESPSHETLVTVGTN